MAKKSDKAKKKTKTPKPEMLGSGMAKNAADKLANRQKSLKQMMEDLGI